MARAIITDTKTGEELRTVSHPDPAKVREYLENWQFEESMGEVTIKRIGF